jgi:hypothetical protein
MSDRQRVRNQLKAFYVAELDSPDFDVEAYMDRLLATNSLDKLIEINKRLRADIVRLDRDLQALVYQNYSKFLIATDIIHVAALSARSLTVPELLHQLPNTRVKVYK